MQIEELRATVNRPATGHFIDAWTRWRGQKLLPCRADLELRDIVPNISSVVLAEVIGPDNIFVRVAGNDFSKSLDFELTGHNFKDRTAPEDWPARSRHYLHMAGRPCGGRMIFENVQSADRKIVYEVVSLPLDPNDPARPRLILSCATAFDRYPTDPQPGRSTVIPAKDFRYVDIGAGLPEDV